MGNGMDTGMLSFKLALVGAVIIMLSLFISSRKEPIPELMETIMFMVLVAGALMVVVGTILGIRSL